MYPRHTQGCRLSIELQDWSAQNRRLSAFLEAVKDESLKYALEYGVGYLHESQTEREQSVVKALYGSGALSVLVVAASECWGLTSAAKTVVVMGTQYYDSMGQAANDYSMSDLLHMVGMAGRAGVDAKASCTLMCHTPRKEYYKKFLFEPLPIESHLDATLHDALCSEVVSKTVAHKQGAVDFGTWTFY